ncbi:MAG: hypothetical protein R2792_20325 [Saprospiraceae bacterium]
MGRLPHQSIFAWSLLVPTGNSSDGFHHFEAEPAFSIEVHGMERKRFIHSVCGECGYVWYDLYT